MTFQGKYNLFKWYNYRDKSHWEERNDKVVLDWRYWPHIKVINFFFNDYSLCLKKTSFTTDFKLKIVRLYRTIL
jgi:hypothetical protein